MGYNTDSSYLHIWINIKKVRFPTVLQLGKDALECKADMELISYVGLMKIVTSFAKCYDVLVKEFIVNIHVDCANTRSKKFRKMFVRGKCVEFSHAIINKYLGRSEVEESELEVTDNQVCKAIITNQVNEWPTNNTSTISAGLGKFIYVVGSKQSFGYGSYIIDQTLKHAGACVVKMHIAFPSLICGIIFNQRPRILSSTDVLCKRESTLSLHFKLFTRKYFPNIILRSASTEDKTSTKAEMISELKEACKELDEIIRVSTARKLKFEKLIKSLTRDKD